MARREKIILGLACVAVLVGIGFLLLGSPRKAAAPRTEGDIGASRDLAAGAIQELAKGALSKGELYVLERAQPEWKADPFLGRKLAPPSEAPKAPMVQEMEVAYTGYVFFGKVRFAIINGFEYAVGEELISGGYVVRSIDSEKVVLKSLGNKQEFVVPFSGEVLRSLEDKNPHD